MWRETNEGCPTLALASLEIRELPPPDDDTKSCSRVHQE
jgi:hypothetical protein